MIKSYETMPVGIYLQLTDVMRDVQDEHDRTIAILSILSGIPEEQLINTPYEQVQRMSDSAGFLLTEPKPAEVRKVYEVGEWRLVPTLKRSRITYAQYAAFQEFSAKGVDDNFVQLLSCFLIPEGKKYNEDYDIEDLCDDIRKHLSIVDANALYTFFLRTLSRSMQNTLNYLRATIMLQTAKTEEEKKAKEEALAKMMEFQRLIRSGVGLRSSTMFIALQGMRGV